MPIELVILKTTTLQHLKLGKLKFGIRKRWVFDELNEIFDEVCDCSVGWSDDDMTQ